MEYSLPLANLWNAKPTADLSRERIRDFGVARHRFNRTGGRIQPEGMGAPLALQHASVLPKVT
jgi:hypothetical protein